MTGDIVNLRHARKTRDRAARETAAAANRRAYGRTRGEREANAIETTRAARLLDGHRLARQDDGEDA